MLQQKWPLAWAVLNTLWLWARPPVAALPGAALHFPTGQRVYNAHEIVWPHYRPCAASFPATRADRGAPGLLSSGLTEK